MGFKIEKLYSLLRAINKVILSAITKQEDAQEFLFKELCNIVVKHFVKFSWVGLYKENKIIPTYYAENVPEEYKSYAKLLEIPLDDSDVRSKGPAVTCFKENKVILIEDIEKAPNMRPWIEEALKRGFRSSATIPIRKGGKVIGVFGMYAEEIGFFQEEEAELLEELSYDIEMALNGIENTKFIKSLESALSRFIDIFIITDENYNISYVGEKTLNVLGYKESELLGKNIGVFYREDVNNDLFKINYESYYKKIKEDLATIGEFNGIVLFRAKKKDVFIDLIAINIKGFGIIYIGKDISKEKALEEELHFILNQDPVTGLFSYSFLMTELEVYVKRAAEVYKLSKDQTLKDRSISNRLGAFILADIYRFTYINDVYGFDIGDKLLKAISNRLKYIFRPTDIIGRIASDTFGIILTDLKDKEDVIILMDKLKKTFEQPLDIDGHKISISMQLGIAIFPDNGTTAKEVYKNADISLSKARRGTEWEYVFFSDELNVKASQFLLYKRHLEEAFRKDEFVIYYQPYFNAKTLDITGFEALTRWRSSELGFVSPAQFIPVLEETGLISKLETWLVNKICMDIQNLNNHFLGKYMEYIPPVAVNISPLSFKSEDVYQKVTDIINKYKDVSGKCLNIEITESLFLEVFDRAINTLKKFKELNFRISLDDFGTGYSSFSYLKDLPIDNLKIDISFIRNILQDKKTESIVKTIIELAHNLGMKTIAEGVETKEQLELLRELGCDNIQGYLLAKPMPFEELLDFIKSWNTKKYEIIH